MGILCGQASANQQSCSCGACRGSEGVKASQQAPFFGANGERAGFDPNGGKRRVTGVIKKLVALSTEVRRFQPNPGRWGFILTNNVRGSVGSDIYVAFDPGAVPTILTDFSILLGPGDVWVSEYAGMNGYTEDIVFIGAGSFSELMLTEFVVK